MNDDLICIYDSSTKPLADASNTVARISSVSQTNNGIEVVSQNGGGDVVAFTQPISLGRSYDLSQYWIQADIVITQYSSASSSNAPDVRVYLVEYLKDISYYTTNDIYYDYYHPVIRLKEATLDTLYESVDSYTGSAVSSSVTDKVYLVLGSSATNYSYQFGVTIKSIKLVKNTVTEGYKKKRVRS